MNTVLRSALVLSVLLLTACGPDRDDPNRLVIWEQMDPAEQQLLREHLDMFEAMHGDSVRVEVVHFETENLRQNFQTAALAGTGPDLVYGPSDGVGPYSIMGLVWDLEDPRLGIPADTLALYLDDALPKVEGRIYRINDQLGNHLTLVRNTALVPEAPRDTEELIRIAKANTVDDRYGIVFNLAEPFWLVPWLGGYGGWVMDEHENPTLDTPAMREALAFVRRLVDEGVIPRSCDYPLADTLFKQGKAAMIINGPWSWQGYRDAGLEIGLSSIPRIAETGEWPKPATSGKGYSLNIHVPETRLDLAVDLLMFLTSAEIVGRISDRLGALPSRVDVGEWPRIANNPALAASWEQLRHGRSMPLVPEMRAIWDVMRPGMQRVVSGSATPLEAAREMQEDALRKIEEMKL